MSYNTNVVIPMAGLGSRFQALGYTLPKPLIDVNGMPMISKAIKTLGIYGNYYFVIRKDENSELIKKVILNQVSNAKFIEINYVTEGPACSVMLFEREINNDSELIVANCDQIMWWNPNLFMINARASDTDGMVVTYHSTTTKNSYAKLNKQGYVTEIKEKEVISNTSLNGIHYWKKGKYFVNSVKEMMRLNDRAPNGEFYVGPSYNHMIRAGLRVGVYHIPIEQHHAVGVPDDLEKYIRLENENV